MAKRLGKSRKYVNKVVGGGSASIETYKEFADALGVPLAAVFDGYQLHWLDS